jgi:hypothetical protein
LKHDLSVVNRVLFVELQIAGLEPPERISHDQEYRPRRQAVKYLDSLTLIIQTQVQAVIEVVNYNTRWQNERY